MPADNEKSVRKSQLKTVAVSRSQSDYPARYRVIMLNDDQTPMDFVVEVLERIFDKPTFEATTIMMDVHLKGSATCGVYPFDIAETKVEQVLDQASSQHYPLKCTLEQDY